MWTLLRSEPRLVVVVALVFAVSMGMGLMVPVLPLFAERFGHGAGEAGFLLAAFGAARLVLNLPAGMLSDRFGRRPVMIAGLAVLTVASFAAAASPSFEWLGVALFGQGIGSALYVTAALAAVADLAPKEQRGTAMSLYQGSLLVGISIGPVFGGFLGGLLGPPGPFLAQGTMVLVGAVLALLMLRETRAASSMSTSLASLPLRNIGTALVLVSATMVVTMIARVVANWQLIPFIGRADFGFGPERIGLLLTAGSIANFVALPRTGRLVDRFGAASVVVVGGTVGALALLVPLAGLGEPGLWLAVALLAVSTGMVAPACSAYALDHSRIPHGATMGLLRMAGDLGIVVGPIFVALLLSFTGIGERGTLVVVAGGMLMVAVVFRVVSKRLGRGGERE